LPRRTLGAGKNELLALIRALGLASWVRRPRMQRAKQHAERDNDRGHQPVRHRVDPPIPAAQVISVSLPLISARSISIFTNP
jgi:hypothetical protein